MLAELRVAQLGVIEDVTMVLGPGMTVLTGETGAGKTLIVDAIALLRRRPGRRRCWCGRGRPRRWWRGGSSAALRATRRLRADAGPSRAAGRAPRLLDGRMASGSAPGRRRANTSSTCTASTPTSRCCTRPPSGPPWMPAAGLSTDDVTRRPPAPSGS